MTSTVNIHMAVRSSQILYCKTFPLIRSCVPNGTPDIATVRPAEGIVPLAVAFPAVPQHCAQLQ